MGSGSGRKPPADKFDERRRALAESALRTLGELGYARASLREIANNSDFSHGVVHYYFQDKNDLITYGVREYKAVCVRRYDPVIAGSRTPDELVAGFADKLMETLADDAAMHRLWYDVRTQSMYDERLREVAIEIDGWLEDMIWRIVSRYAELSGAEPAMPSSVLYGIFDGLFQQALVSVTLGGRAEPDLRTLVHQLLPTMITASVRV
jgi:TetR/AcrR family transcriptional repressor of bet genes